jgi:hypothetical protein
MDTIEDGWMNLVTPLQWMHPLYAKAKGILSFTESIDEEAFNGLVIQPGDKFSRLEECYGPYEAPAKATALGFGRDSVNLR